MDKWIIPLTVDLQHGAPLRRTTAQGLMLPGDDAAHTVSVTVRNGDAPATLAGAARGYFTRADGMTVVCDGELTDNTVRVTLDRACYAVPGPLRCVIRVETDATYGLGLSLVETEFSVREGIGEEIVDPGGAFPTLEAQAQRLSALQEAEAALAGRMEVAEGRIDGLVALPAGSTAGDAELADIRVSADGIAYPTAGGAVRAQAAALKQALIGVGSRLHTAEYIIPHAWINSSGVVEAVTASAIGGNNDYDLIVYQVAPGDVIEEITTDPVTVVFAYYADAPGIGSVSYNNGRRASSLMTLTNNAVPAGVSWIAIRKKAGTDIRYVSVPYFDQMLEALADRVDALEADAISIKTAISSVDLDECTSTGLYLHAAGADVGNAPAGADGGVVMVYRIEATILQVYVATCATHAQNAGRIFYRFLNADGPATEWQGFDAGHESPRAPAVRIAFFGDSCVWGAIKTASGSSYITTQASPRLTDTMANLLKCPVDNYGLSGAGYKTAASSGVHAGKNIFDYLRTVDLSAYTHIVFMAGDNDSSVGGSGIGTYLDTDDATIMGQIYRIMCYLHENYPQIVPVICHKNNKIAFKTAAGVVSPAFGSFPDYYYGYTYVNGFSIARLHEEIDKFCAYYGVCRIDFQDFCMRGWKLQQIVGPDQTHFTQYGYDLLGAYLAGQLRKFIG